MSKINKYYGLLAQLLLLISVPAAAANYNANISGPISSGSMLFTFSDQLAGNISGSVTGGTQEFRDSSNLSISAANAITGGAQSFYDNSFIFALTTNGISGGTQEFHDGSNLNAYAVQTISAGNQTFYDSSYLATAVDGAVSVGTQIFNNSSRLIAFGSITGGTQIFNDTTRFEALVANAINGGSQTFNGNSELIVVSVGGVNGGYQTFYGTSTLSLITTDGITGGTQAFNDSSKLILAYGVSLSSSAVAIDLISGTSLFSLGGTPVLIGSLTGSGTVSTIAFGSVLTIDTSLLGSSTFNGQLAGGGSLSLIKQGAGTWDFAGDGIGMNGTTNINGGTLAVNGNLENSPVTINTGGTLGGNGRVGSTVVESGGIVAPGNSIGTLTVNGSLTFNPGSIYNVEIDAAGAADRTNVIGVPGTATINGGTVNVLASAGTYAANTSYTILNAINGVTGNFSGVTSNLAFLTPTLNNTGNDIVLSLARNSTSFADVARTFNQRNAAAGLTSIGVGVLATAVTALDANTARSGLAQLSGELHASVQGALVEDTDFVRSAMLSRLYQPDGNSVWFKGSSTHAYNESTSNTDNTARHMNGGIIGTDRIIGDSENWTAGLLAGYGDTRFSTLNSTASIDSVHLGTYAGRNFGNVQLKLGAAYGYHQLDTDRSLTFGSFSGHESADYTAQTGQAFADIGYRIVNGEGSIVPFVNMAQIYTTTERFNERGDAAALHIKNEQSNVTLGTLGVRFDQPLALLDRLPLTLLGSFGIRHAEGDVTPQGEARFQTGHDFDIRGNPIARNAFVYDIGLNGNFASDFDAGISYRGQSGDDSKSHAANVYMTWVF